MREYHPYLKAAVSVSGAGFPEAAAFYAVGCRAKKRLIAGRSKIMRRIKSFLILLVILAVCTPLLFIVNGYRKYRSAVEAVPIEQKADEIRQKEHFCALSYLPEDYVNAVVSVEDRRFYKHAGFDAIGVARAILTDIKTRSLREGGSTISQQLAKNMYFPIDNTPERKIAEIFCACELERIFGKEQILELYFNCIYFGSGYYCVYDAAMGYFGKEPKEMTLAESALLAGVPNAPSVYSPKVNPELAAKRRKKVLSAMVSCGHISKEQAQAAGE